MLKLADDHYVADGLSMPEIAGGILELSGPFTVLHAPESSNDGLRDLIAE